MKKRLLAAAAAASVLMCAGGGASAQMIVHDQTAMMQMLKDAQTSLKQLHEMQKQLQEAQRLYDGLNKVITDPNSIGEVLNNPVIRGAMPEQADALGALARGGSINDLGDLSRRVGEVREAYRAFTPNPDGAKSATDRYYENALENAGNRAARDLAVGERVYEASSVRLMGLEQLRRAISHAPNARAVMDLEARLAAETAMMQNELVRLQGLQMMQAAEEKLERQREAEGAHAQLQRSKDFFKKMGKGR